MASFNSDAYLKNKAKQLNKTGQGGKTNWTADSAKKAISDAGLSLKDHYNRYGKDEGISTTSSSSSNRSSRSNNSSSSNSSSGLDRMTYLTNKTRQLNETAQGGASDWSVVNTENAIRDAGMSLQEHYDKFGNDEGIIASGNTRFGIDINSDDALSFDEDTYLENKADQLNQTKQDGKGNWAPESTRNAIADAGMTLTEHYRNFGAREEVSPFAVKEEERRDISIDPGNLGVENRSPAQTEVTPDQTVQGQLDQILASDSPLMQRVGNKARQSANSRGLLNSSMAEQASQGAMIDQGAQIASQDAQTYFQNSQANAGREQQDYMGRLGFEQDLKSAEQRYNIDSALIQQEGDRAMEKLYGTSMANAWGVMGNNVTDIVGQSMQQISTIQNNPNINAEDKTRMIEDIMAARDQDVQFQAELYSTLPGTLQDTGIFPETVG